MKFGTCFVDPLLMMDECDPNYDPSEDRNFSNALRYALSQGYIVISPDAFEGWLPECTCPKCQSQRIVMDFVEACLPNKIAKATEHGPATNNAE